METAQSVREDYLQQNAFADTDAYTPLKQQFALARLILSFRDKASEAIKAGADVQKISEIGVRERIGRAKSAPADRFEEEYADIEKQLDAELAALISERSDD